MMLAESNPSVEVEADDTDIFVLLLNFYNLLNLNSRMYMEAPQKGRSVIDIQESVKKYKPYVNMILPTHALSGWDTVAQCHGIGKTRALKVAKSGIYSNLLGDINSDIEAVLPYATKFIVVCYGNPNSESLSQHAADKMPLLNKKPFVRTRPPAKLPPNHELFYCHFTYEVFEDYEQFFQRIILCNSLVWTCEITGRPGLTFREAKESEKRAKKFLSEFPCLLKKPLLYLTTYTRRGRLADLCDDIFLFVRDRYFIGENVEYLSEDGSRKIALKKGSRERSLLICRETGTKGIVKEKINLFMAVTYEHVSSENESNEDSQADIFDAIKPTLCIYEIKTADSDAIEIVNIKSSQISRRKGCYTREKNKLYLKQATQPVAGLWAVKEKYLTKYQLLKMEFSDIFTGPPPKFKTTPMRKRICVSKESGKSRETVKPVQKPVKQEQDLLASKKKFKMTEEEREIKKEAMKKKSEEEKKLRKEEKLKEKERKLEERRVVARYNLEWSKPRDDLCCEDLKDLPIPNNVCCSLPQEYLGDVLMTLEFFHIFKDVLEVENFFPNGLDFEMLEKALVCTEIDGPFKTIIQFLLETIFSFQDDGSEVVKIEDKYPDQFSRDVDTELTVFNAVKQSEIFANWAQKYHAKDSIDLAKVLTNSIKTKLYISTAGTPLKDLPIDSFTLTEVLRLHLLSSGSTVRQLEGCSRSEDPGLRFNLEHAGIVEQLHVSNVFDFRIDDKVELINTLVHQIMAHEYVREYIDEALVATRQNKNELKQLRITEAQRDREFSMQYKKLSDARTIEKYIKLKEDEGENNDKLNGIINDASADMKIVDEEVEKVKKMTDRQWEDYSDRLIRDESKKKETFFKREQVLMELIVKNQTMSFISPLGRDRAYRRYWLFTSIPGLFVEDNDLEYMGSCLENPTPYDTELQADSVGVPNVTLDCMKKYIENNSDKENENYNSNKNKVLKKVNKASVDVCLSEKNGDVPEVTFDSKSVNDDPNELKVSEIESKKIQVFGMCTANEDTCPVHSVRKKRNEWCLFCDVDSIEELINNLNVRGFRERELLENLKSEKWRLYNHLLTCQKQLLPLQIDSEENIIENIDQSAAKIFELNLRDMIVDLEEKIYHGTLGCLKVKDRLAWKSAIEDESYDKQCATIEWGGNSISNVNELITDTNNSTKIVKKLACAILQLAQGIEPKYLKQPLVGWMRNVRFGYKKKGMTAC
ncbi:Bromodomain adjacent to zinc finger domain protein 1A [Nymphon striatum]|nr:Bromodomain adjacent to zinc finger domain protein 1A [Nymphon striatum]